MGFEWTDNGRKSYGLSAQNVEKILPELVEQRSTAIRIQNKMLALLKDAEDMTVIGPVIKEQQKIINDTIEKKLSLSKLQSSIWEKSNNSKEESFSLSDMDEDTLQSLIQKDVDNSKGQNYQL